MNIQKLSAVALKYDDSIDDAPFIAAQGQLLVAKEMKAIARRYGIPICTNEELTENLQQLQCNQNIPQSLYLEVAKILAPKK
jgi:type III secretion system FlhB-like substrate exporter